MAKSRASGATRGVEKQFTGKVGNRLAVTIGGTKLTYTYNGKGEFYDDFNTLHKIKNIPGGINGIASRADKFEILPPQEYNRRDAETRISKEAARAARLYRKSKAPGARHFSL